MENIKLNKRETLRFGIVNYDDTPKLDENGEQVYLEFDLEDIELPLRYNKCYTLMQQAQTNYKMKKTIIDKREDKKGKYLLSKNEQDTIEALNEYYEKMEEAMDLFLGEGGVKKIFGDVKYASMYDDLNDMLQPILPKLKISAEDISKKIMEKYGDKKEMTLTSE